MNYNSSRGRVVKALACGSESRGIESYHDHFFFFFTIISKMHIEIVRASISIQFDSIQSIVSKFRCIDPTLIITFANFEKKFRVMKFQLQATRC